MRPSGFKETLIKRGKRIVGFKSKYSWVASFDKPTSSKITRVLLERKTINKKNSKEIIPECSGYTPLWPYELHHVTMLCKIFRHWQRDQTSHSFSVLPIGWSFTGPVVLQKNQCSNSGRVYYIFICLSPLHITQYCRKLMKKVIKNSTTSSKYIIPVTVDGPIHVPQLPLGKG